MLMHLFGFMQVLWLTCFYTWEVYEGLKPTMQAIMGHGVKAYVVFGDTDNDRYGWTEKLFESNTL